MTMYDIISSKGDVIMATKMISLRIDESLVNYYKERAEEEHRTLSNMIITVLAVEQKKDKGKSFLCCSKCHTEYDRYDRAGEDMTKFYKYCANCGAKGTVK